MYRSTSRNMTGRISAKFDELASKRQRALVAYIMAGYPDIPSTISAVRGLARGGADIIEIGFPFSDPLADGPAIQAAATASLQNGTCISDCMDIVRTVRAESEIPLAIMTYTNILYRTGYGRFMSEASSAGADGLILPDMAIEEATAYVAEARRHDLDTIFLVSPNTPATRMRRIINNTTGFLYLVAVYGTTGVQDGIKDYTIRAIRRAKRISGRRLPLGVGFGISDYNDAARYVQAGADAVIVGSALVRIIGDSPPDRIESRVARFAKDLKRATLP